MCIVLCEVTGHNPFRIESPQSKHPRTKSTPEKIPLIHLGLGVGVSGYMLGLRLGFCPREFLNVFIQYVVRIEMLIRSGGDFVRGDYVRRGFCRGFIM